MLNMLTLVGRLANQPILEENDGKVCKITLAVPRNYKNEEGVYETDFIDCVLENNIATNTCEYCKKGDLVGIKGKLKTEYIENEDNSNKKIMIVAVDSVSFLAQRKED